MRRGLLGCQQAAWEPGMLRFRLMHSNTGGKREDLKGDGHLHDSSVSALSPSLCKMQCKLCDFGDSFSVTIA